MDITIKGKGRKNGGTWKGERSGSIFLHALVIGRIHNYEFYQPCEVKYTSLCLNNITNCFVSPVVAKRK